MKNLKSKIQNWFLVMAALVFAFGVLATSVWKTSAQTAKNLPLATPPAEKKEEIKKPVDYFLAYPGILPDHFLYPIKMIRDKIWLFLTVDPLKKAEVLLLFADKRLGAGRSLIEKGKIDLGVRTLTKAEKYLEKAVNQEKVAREKGKNTEAFRERLTKATLKHEEVLLKIKEKLEEPGIKATIEEILSYPRRGYEEVKK